MYLKRNISVCARWNKEGRFISCNVNCGIQVDSTKLGIDFTTEWSTGGTTLLS